MGLFQTAKAISLLYLVENKLLHKFKELYCLDALINFSLYFC